MGTHVREDATTGVRCGHGAFGLAAAVVLVGAGLVAAAPSAVAAESENALVRVGAEGKGGKGKFQADPSNGKPGDAIKSCDTKKDGWGIITRLHKWNGSRYEPIRKVEWRGGAGDCSKWKTGDLPEGLKIAITACKVKKVNGKDEFAGCGYDYGRA